MRWSANLRRILFALGATVCAASAQPTPAAQAKALLESPRLEDKAWGAYSAAQLQDRDLQDALIAQLHWAETLRESPPQSSGDACIQALLDALIQRGAPVPTEAILPYATPRRAEALILLASHSTSSDEASLLDMREKNLNEAEWLTVNNILMRQRSAAFFARTLREIHLTHRFVVVDTGAPRGTGTGGSFAWGRTTVGFAAGFPPIAIYQLEIVEWGTPSPGVGDIRLIAGPLGLGDVFYRRTVVPAGGSAPKDGRNFRETDRQIYRRAYVAHLGGLSMSEAEALLCPTTIIRWRSSRGLSQEAERAMGSQADGIRKFALAAQARGLGPVRGMRLRIDPLTDDSRISSKGSLPPLRPREISLD